MEAKELRIGNWVYNATIKKEMQVYPMMIAQLSMVEGESNIEPIPLTEEWLLRFGFEKNGEEWFIHENNFELVFDEGKYFYTWDYNWCTSFGIKYIHQLQNLYFALTGEELQLIN